MPFPRTRVIHPQWSEHNAQVSDDAMNCVLEILQGTATDWSPDLGVIPGDANEIYSGPGRASYDLDRPFTKDNADQITSTSIVLVAVPRAIQARVFPGNTINVLSVDENGLEELAGIHLRVLSQRHSSYSWGVVFDCMETAGRANG